MTAWVRGIDNFCKKSSLLQGMEQSSDLHQSDSGRRVKSDSKTAGRFVNTPHFSLFYLLGYRMVGTGL